MQTKQITILGSSGSIGKNTLEVIRSHPDQFKVYALAAHSNIDVIEKQAREFNPKKIVVFDERKAKELRKRLSSYCILSGEEGLVEISTDPKVDYLLLAMTGVEGLRPAICAIKEKKQIGLANKELLVCAGEIITRLCRENGVTLLPVDSEHSALFQCLNKEKIEQVKRLILTASGGPFYKFSDKELQRVTHAQALVHPNWKMGEKITIDSSNLMNKGLEVIEAHWLFGIEKKKIDVVIHPQSIVHSMVEFLDSSIIAQMSEPTMKLPIQYALSYPERISSSLAKIDFTKAFQLEFLPPDHQKFPCLNLCYQALNFGKSYCCYLNAANEVLVKRFLNKEISWIDIMGKLKKLIASHTPEDMLTLEAILEIDQRARGEAVFI